MPTNVIPGGYPQLPEEVEPIPVPRAPTAAEIEQFKLEPDPKPKTCVFEEVFHANFIELVKLSPKNEMVRGNIMRVCKKEPPVEADTFDKIKDWMEHNFSLNSLLK